MAKLKVYAGFVSESGVYSCKAIRLDDGLVVLEKPKQLAGAVDGAAIDTLAKECEKLFKSGYETVTNLDQLAAVARPLIFQSAAIHTQNATILTEALDQYYALQKLGRLASTDGTKPLSISKETVDVKLADNGRSRYSVNPSRLKDDALVTLMAIHAAVIETPSSQRWGNQLFDQLYGQKKPRGIFSMV